jgi:hypothetical protein
MQSNAVNDNQQDVCFGFYGVSSPLLAVAVSERREETRERWAPERTAPAMKREALLS